MPINTDLLDVKAKLERSASSLTGAVSSLGGLASKVPLNLAPDFGVLQGALTKASGALTGVVGQIGAGLNNLSPTSLPDINKALKSLTPSFDELGDLAKGLSSKLPTSLKPEFKPTLDVVQTETVKVNAVKEVGLAKLQTVSTFVATPLPQLIDEIERVHTTISGYSNDLGSYLYNPTGNSLPTFDETQLGVDQLLETLRNNKDAAVDLTSGAMTSTVYKAAGIVREIGTRRMTKAMAYDSAVSYSASETEEVRGTSGKKVAELRSMTPSQSEGV